MNNYTREMIEQVFGKDTNCSFSVTQIDGKQIQFLILKNKSFIHDSLEVDSVNELRSATTVTHMNASLSLINSGSNLSDTKIGFELSMGVLVDFIDVYRLMVTQLQEKKIQSTFFISFDDDFVDLSSGVVESVITDLISVGADFAIDNLQTVSDFEKVEYLFELITKIRLDFQKKPTIDLIERLSSRSIQAIRQLT